MENASKALIMAAGVLIGIMILSLVVYLFVSFGSSTAQIGEKIKQDQLNKFNSQFTSYEGKEGLTIYDVITVANLATENNKYYNYSNRSDTSQNDSYVSVILENKHIEGKEEADYNKLIINDTINNESDSLANYTCKVYINEITSRVYKITFSVKK